MTMRTRMRAATDTVRRSPRVRRNMNKIRMESMANNENTLISFSAVRNWRTALLPFVGAIGIGVGSGVGLVTAGGTEDSSVPRIWLGWGAGGGTAAMGAGMGAGITGVGAGADAGGVGATCATTGALTRSLPKYWAIMMLEWLFHIPCFTEIPTSVKSGLIMFARCVGEFIRAVWT